LRLHIRSKIGAGRPGTAVTELALLAPFLTFLFVVVTDFARIIYFSLTIQNAACNGALYGCVDLAHATNTTGIQTAALTDTTNLAPNPDVTSSTSQDANGNTQVNVTVTYTFQPLVQCLGAANSITLHRSVSMRVMPP
jgi:Flp pilus assembly protein TadG